MCGSNFGTPFLMNMCNITFSVHRLSTFLFNKCTEKNIFMIIFVVRSLKGLAGIMLAQRPNITSVMGQCIVLFDVSGAGIRNVTRIMQQSEHTVQSPNGFLNDGTASKTGSTLKQHWVYATCLRKVYSRPSDGLVMGQRRRRFTGIGLQRC